LFSFVKQLPSSSYYYYLFGLYLWLRENDSSFCWFTYTHIIDKYREELNFERKKKEVAI
jgi:hypothetical protein